MKKLLTFFAIAAILGAGCNNNKTNSGTGAVSNEEVCTAITIDSFLVIAPENIGKELTVKGTVAHVCKHGGKRVKLITTSSSNFIHGEASKKVGTFNAELEGSDVCLIGTVLETKIDMAYVDEWEAKEQETMAKNAEESEMAHKEGVDHHATLEQIKKYREEIAASEKGYIAFYSLDVTKFHECGATINDGCGKKTNDSVEMLNIPEGQKTEAGACGGCKEKKSGCGGDDKKTAESKPCCEQE